MAYRDLPKLPDRVQLWEGRQHIMTLEIEQQLFGGLYVAKVLWSRHLHFFELVDTEKRIAAKILRSGWWRIECAGSYEGDIILDGEGHPIDLKGGQMALI